MDQNTQRQAMRLAKRFLPRILRWLKNQFSNKPQNQSSHSAGGGFQAQQTYAQPTQQPYSQQPQQQQQPYYPQQQEQQDYYHSNQNQHPSTYSGAANDYYNQGGPSSGPLHPVTNQQSYPPIQQQPAKPHHAWSSGNDGSIGQDAISLRNQANQEGDLMSSCFDRAHEAHQRGDGAAAKDLSSQGHQHQANMKRLNAQAADLIYEDKNRDHPLGSGTIDLHGLYVEESIDKTEEAIKDGQSRGLPELRVIVGKGIHSTAHVAKIKPAIEKLMRDYNLSAHLDPHNAGVLIVNLQQGVGSRDMSFVHDLARQQPGSDDQCVIC